MIENGIPFSVFVVSNLIGDWNRWDFKENLPELKLMDEDKLRSYSNTGFCTIGSHTLNHNCATSVNKDICLRDFILSKKNLEIAINKDIEYLSYPYGEYNHQVMKMASKAGYKRAYIVNKKIDEDLPNFGILRNEIRQY